MPACRFLLIRRSFLVSARTRLSRALLPSELLGPHARRASTATAAAPPKHAQELTTPTPDPSLAFHTLHIHPNTLKAITVRPFTHTHMSPVQAQILPMLPHLALPYETEAAPSPGRALPPHLQQSTASINTKLDPEHPRDLLVKAKTGTGKTMAFLVPAIEARLNALDAHAQSLAPASAVSLSPNDLLRAQTTYARNTLGTLIISPTRELATQIAVEASNLTTHHRGFQVQVLLGGESKGRQMREWRTGRKDIVVATPGRLLDLINSEPEVARLVQTTKLLVLDEADTLLDMGFRDDITRITTSLPPTPQRQTFLFSATVSRAIQSIAQSTLSPNHAFINCVSPSDSAVHAHIPQYHTVLREGADLLPHVLRLLASDQLESSAKNTKSKVIVFLSTTNAVILFSQLLRAAVAASALPHRRTAVYEMHAKREMRQRTRVSAAFREDAGAASILVTSDVSARGVDYPGVTRVIQVGAPSGADVYVHRVGRTGRGARRDGRGDLVLMSWEMGLVSGKLREFGLKPVTKEDVEKGLEGLIASSAASSSPSSSASSSSPSSSTQPKYTLTTLQSLPSLSSHLTSQLAHSSPSEVQSAFSSQLGFFLGKAPSLGLNMSAILQGLKEQWVSMWGLEREPGVSRVLGGMLGGLGGGSSSHSRGTSWGSSGGSGGYSGSSFSRDRKERRGGGGSSGWGASSGGGEGGGGGYGYGYAKGTRQGLGSARRWGASKESAWEAGGAGGWSEKARERGWGASGRNEEGGASGYARERSDGFSARSEGSRGYGRERGGYVSSSPTRGRGRRSSDGGGGGGSWRDDLD